jgi:tRNA dimethylallyltransferase
MVAVWPTAVGKTKLAAALAKSFSGEIISADSRQVYRRMDIGTGKDLKDYIIDGYSVPYHLIDIIDPSGEFNLFMFQKLFYESYDKIRSENKLPFLAGGTGLYIDSIIKDYKLAEINAGTNELNDLDNNDIDELKSILISLKPELHNSTDLTDKNRLIKAILIARKDKHDLPKIHEKLFPLIIGINPNRELVKKRITLRLKERLNSGMIDEVIELVESGISYEKLNFFGLEYKYIGQYLQGKLNYNDMFQKLNSAIHDFAKRQMTWFRKMEKEGAVINWIEEASFEQASFIIEKHFSNNSFLLNG